MKDIENREDIQFLIDTFYKDVVKDEKIGEFFTTVVALDWQKHLPIMYDFWESMLLGAGKYRGNPMLKHIALSQKKPLKPDHFERWLSLWASTIHSHFQGKKAEEAISKAHQISGLMQFKIAGQNPR
jgi:hemoglobin